MDRERGVEESDLEIDELGVGQRHNARRAGVVLVESRDELVAVDELGTQQVIGDTDQDQVGPGQGGGRRLMPLLARTDLMIVEEPDLAPTL